MSTGKVEFTANEMQRAAMKAAAEKAGLSLSAWARSTLVAAASASMAGESK